MKDIMELNPPATIVVAGHSTLSGVSIGTLVVCVIEAQGFFQDMMLSAMNMPGLGRHLFSGRTAGLENLNTIISKK